MPHDAVVGPRGKALVERFVELHTTVIPVFFLVSVFPGIRYSRYRYFSVGIIEVLAKFLPLWFG